MEFWHNLPSGFRDDDDEDMISQHRKRAFTNYEQHYTLNEDEYKHNIKALNNYKTDDLITPTPHCLIRQKINESISHYHRINKEKSGISGGDDITSDSDYNYDGINGMYGDDGFLVEDELVALTITDSPKKEQSFKREFFENLNGKNKRRKLNRNRERGYKRTKSDNKVYYESSDEFNHDLDGFVVEDDSENDGIEFVDDLIAGGLNDDADGDVVNNLQPTYFGVKLEPQEPTMEDVDINGTKVRRSRRVRNKMEEKKKKEEKKIKKQEDVLSVQSATTALTPSANPPLPTQLAAINPIALANGTKPHHNNGNNSNNNNNNTNSNNENGDNNENGAFPAVQATISDVTHVINEIDDLTNINDQEDTAAAVNMIQQRMDQDPILRKKRGAPRKKNKNKGRNPDKEENDTSDDEVKMNDRENVNNTITLLSNNPTCTINTRKRKRSTGMPLLIADNLGNNRRRKSSRKKPNPNKNKSTKTTATKKKGKNSNVKNKRVNDRPHVLFAANVEMPYYDQLIVPFATFQERRKKHKTTHSKKEVNSVTKLSRNHRLQQIEKTKGCKLLREHQCLLKVALFHSNKSSERYTKSHEYLVLSSQKLSDLKDQFYCLMDITPIGKELKNSYFFIEDTFHDDMRHVKHKVNGYIYKLST